MFAVLSNGDSVRIVFRHRLMPRYQDLGHLPDGTLVKVRVPYAHDAPQATTECLIVGGTKDAPKEYAHSVARCAWEDQYVKEVGRRLSLMRAVTQLAPEDRGLVLHAYYNRARGNRDGR